MSDAKWLKEGIRIFFEYIKGNRIGRYLFVSFLSIFIIITCLYDLPGSAILYFLILLVTVSAIIIMIDFFFFYNKHKALLRSKEQIMISLENLPKAANLIESDYSQLLKILNTEKNRIYATSNDNEKDMIDYYTLWVHQIKTPVAAMKLMLQENETELNRELSLELFKIEQYVDMVLQYLRLGSEFTDYSFQKQDLDKIVKQAVRKYAPLFIRKKIALNLSNLEYDVITDEKWLVFVVEQILSNALKYTKLGSISICTEQIESGILLIIRDTGIGIASEDLPRIFDKSFTGYNGRLDKKSTGLGLYLCKQILNKLSHSIEITSKEGEGTTVKIGFYNQANLTKMKD